MYSSAHESPQKKPKITLGGEKEQKKESAALIELINDNLTDPITLEIMDDPVILVETGMTYNRDSIIHALKERPVCPLTNTKITNFKVLNNFKVREILNTMGHPLKPLPSEKIEQKIKKVGEQELMDLPAKITHACIQRLKLSLAITWDQLITRIAIQLNEPVARFKKLKSSKKDLTDERIIMALYLLFEEKGQILQFKNIIANLDLPQVLNNSTANPPLNMFSASPNQPYLTPTTTTTTYSSNNNNNYPQTTPIRQAPAYIPPVGAPPVGTSYNSVNTTNYPQTTPIRQAPAYIAPVGAPPVGTSYNLVNTTNYSQTSPIGQVPTYIAPVGALPVGTSYNSVSAANYPQTTSIGQASPQANNIDSNITNSSYPQLVSNTTSSFSTEIGIEAVDNSQLDPESSNNDVKSAEPEKKSPSIYQSSQSFFGQNIGQVENLFEKEEDLPDDCWQWQGMTP